MRMEEDDPFLFNGKWYLKSTRDGLGVCKLSLQIPGSAGEINPKGLFSKRSGLANNYLKNIGIFTCFNQALIPVPPAGGNTLFCLTLHHPLN